MKHKYACHHIHENYFGNLWIYEGSKYIYSNRVLYPGAKSYKLYKLYKLCKLYNYFVCIYMIFLLNITLCTVSWYLVKSMDIKQISLSLFECAEWLHISFRYDSIMAIKKDVFFTQQWCNNGMHIIIYCCWGHHT